MSFSAAQAYPRLHCHARNDHPDRLDRPNRHDCPDLADRPECADLPDRVPKGAFPEGPTEGGMASRGSALG
eukprot:12397348-Alexandrium_andersonii.AAC.1